MKEEKMTDEVKLESGPEEPAAGDVELENMLRVEIYAENVSRLKIVSTFQKNVPHAICGGEILHGRTSIRDDVHVLRFQLKPTRSFTPAGCGKGLLRPDNDEAVADGA